MLEMSPQRRHSGPAVPGAVWFRDADTARPAPGLTRAGIVTAAVALLDQRGEAGLSLRRLAKTLDVHATSLYWHVATRDDLLDLALDEVFGELDLPHEHTADWADDIATYMHDLRGLLLRHPWATALASSRPLLGPNALARSEFVYTALASAGFIGTDLSAAAAAITNLVIGATAAETAWQHQQQDTARAAVGEHLQTHAERYPTLAAHIPVLDEDWDAHFTRSTTFLLEGLAASRPVR